MSAKEGGYIGTTGGAAGTQAAATTEIKATNPSFAFGQYTTSANVLVIAGGGAGGTFDYGQGGGGGGAGGLILYDSMPVTGATNFPITIGAGGTNSPRSSGSDSVFTEPGETLTAKGGGKGGAPAVSGGSGGGGG